MNDTREPLAAAFATFRTEAADEIRPPGTATARQAVGRRRRVQAGGLAALVAVALTGAGYLATNPSTTPDQLAATPDPAATPGPVRGADELQTLALDALAQLGRTPTDTRPGAVFGPLDQASGSFRYTLGSAAEPFPAGDYALHAACLGGGTATVLWTADGRNQDVAVPCGGTMVTAAFALTGPGTVEMWVRPDEAATDRAGIAVILTDPRQVAAVAKLGPDPGGLRAAAAGMAEVDLRDSDEREYPSGDYLLQVACAGPGEVVATLTIGVTNESAAVACAGEPIDIPLSVTGTWRMAEIAIEPDDAARGQAGYAYRVVRR